jgi:hypothetical protein
MYSVDSFPSLHVFFRTQDLVRASGILEDLASAPCSRVDVVKIDWSGRNHIRLVVRRSENSRCSSMAESRYSCFAQVCVQTLDGK